jgi:ribosomal protein S18 acetylase RimI-like enzyme
MSGTKMTDYAGGAERPIGKGAGTAILQDATTLNETLRKVICTSPDSILRTVEDVNAKSMDYWVDEIRSSTWVVAEQGGEVVGVAACKYPDPRQDNEDRAESRYIESVWIAPGLRRKGLGARLIRYLMHAEYRKNRLIRQFLLWVFTTNSSAISLYKRLGFVQTTEKNKGIRTEIKYRLEVTPGTRAAIFQAVGEAALLADKEKYGITYRVLGEEDSA